VFGFRHQMPYFIDLAVANNSMGIQQNKRLFVFIFLLSVHKQGNNCPHKR